MPLADVDDRGRMVIPHDLREAAGIHPGSKVAIELGPGGEVVLRPALPMREALRRLNRHRRYPPRAPRPAGRYAPGQGRMDVRPSHEVPAMMIVDTNHWAFYLDDEAPEHPRVAPRLEALLDEEPLLQTTIIQLDFAHLAHRRWPRDAQAPVGLWASRRRWSGPRRPTSGRRPSSWTATPGPASVATTRACSRRR